MSGRWSYACRSLPGVPLCLWLAVACLGGCQGQGEGELCNRLAGNNGNDDCQNGLECNTSVVMSSPGFGRCCPGDRALATTIVCQGTTGGINADAAPPATPTGQSPAEASAEETSSSSDSGGPASDAAGE